MLEAKPMVDLVRQADEEINIDIQKKVSPEKIQEKLKLRNKLSDITKGDIKALEGLTKELDNIVAKEVEKAKKLTPAQAGIEAVSSTAGAMQEALFSMRGYIPDAYIALNNKFKKTINEAVGKDILPMAPELSEKTRERLYNNYFTEVGKQLKEKNNYIDRRYQGRNLFDVARDEGKSAAVEYALVHSLASAPYSIGAAVMGYLGIPLWAIAAIFGVLGAGSEQKEMRKKQEAGDLKMDYDTGTIVSGLYGAIEGVSELLGSARFGREIRQLVKTAGKETAELAVKNTVLTGMKTAAKGVLEEGVLEEGTGSLAKSFVDYLLTPDKPDARKVVEDWIENVTVGSFASGPMSVMGGMTAANTVVKAKETQQVLNRYKELLDSGITDQQAKIIINKEQKAEMEGKLLQTGEIAEDVVQEAVQEKQPETVETEVAVKEETGPD